jgi:hypothetical protein
MYKLETVTVYLIFKVSPMLGRGFRVRRSGKEGLSEDSGIKFCNLGLKNTFQCLTVYDVTCSGGCSPQLGGTCALTHSYLMLVHYPITCFVQCICMCHLIMLESYLE